MKTSLCAALFHLVFLYGYPHPLRDKHEANVFMNFVSHGNQEGKSLLFIHGLASTADLCFHSLLPYLKNYHLIFCELDGHSAAGPPDIVSMEESIEKIENYLLKEKGGRIDGLCGFSLGASIAVDLIGRGRISAGKVLLDAPITIEMGWMAVPFTWAFMLGADRIGKGKFIPEFLLHKMMGKNNKGITDMIYPQVTQTTIRNACQYMYHYQFPENLRNFTCPVLLWRGSEEPIPEKSERKLRAYLPQMKAEVYSGMGHGQFLHEHPEEYAARLHAFFSEEASEGM